MLWRIVCLIALVRASLDRPLPAGWRVAKDAQGRAYYIAENGATQWEPPGGASEVTEVTQLEAEASELKAALEGALQRASASESELASVSDELRAQALELEARLTRATEELELARAAESERQALVDAAERNASDTMAALEESQMEVERLSQLNKQMQVVAASGGLDLGSLTGHKASLLSRVFRLILPTRVLRVPVVEASLNDSERGSQLRQLRSARAEIRTLNRTLKALRADSARSQVASTKLEEALNAQLEAAETLTTELEGARTRATDKAAALRALEAEHNRSLERVDELSNRTRVRPCLFTRVWAARSSSSARPRRSSRPCCATHAQLRATRCRSQYSRNARRVRFHIIAPNERVASYPPVPGASPGWRWGCCRPGAHHYTRGIA